MPPVTIYTLRGCPYCWRAKRLLRRKGARFQEIGTTKRAKERTAELRAEFAQRFGSTTFPQVLVGDRHIGGFKRLSALERSGELDHMLGEHQEVAGITPPKGR